MELHYRAWREGHKIYQELRVGDADDGISIDGKARDLLKAVYLKPLRDAEREMSSGRSSRISQILLNHPVFKDKNEHTVLGIFQDANQKIEEYFTNDPEGKSILQTIRDNLEAFNDKGQKSDAELKTSDIQIKAILESLSLKAPELNPGLGELNLLFIAAELLLLKDDTDGGLKLALIEELEAHLHPQAQLRLISYLQNEYNENDVQIIVSTHSPILASKINLKNLILMKDGKGFDLAEGATGLQKGDYLFLQRFLDSTKANLFFAKGIIMVEGDAENILIPVIADIIGYPLEKYGVSIVNVGSTAFLRYSGILIRKNGEKIGIPVSVITDCDVRPYDSLMYQRNNKNYEMLINICYFVLDGMLQTTDKGNYKMMTFSDEHMHRLYEKFVLEYFKRHHSYLSEVRAAQVKWNLATDTEESMIRFLPAMQTDIFLRYKEKVLIIDTKYYGNSMQKQYDKVTIHSGNMYQIFTYVKNQDVENNGRVSGMLLYAKTEEAITPDCSFVIGGNKISVKTVDLNKEFKLIAAQLDKIAEDYFGKKRIEDSII